MAKSRNVIFPRSSPPSTSHIPLPGPPEGEYRPGNLQVAQETPEGEAESISESQAPDPIDHPIQLLPDNAPPADDLLQFLQIRTRAQNRASDSPLVQIRSDHGAVQTESQTASCAMQASDSIDKPSVNDALNGPNAEQWRSAMDVEVAQLLNLDTFELVPLPAD